MHRMKFISYEGPMHQMIVLFPNSMDHHTMAIYLGLVGKHKQDILGAGFISKGRQGEYVCIGKSTSLNVAARPEEDTKLLQRMLDPD